MNYDLIEQGMRLILKGLEVDPSDPNFHHTPERYRRFLSEMFESKETRWATFEEDYTDFVLLRDHSFWSLCPHHMLPVEMMASLAYIPNGQVLGLSKLARVFDDLNRYPLLQEKATREAISRVKRICKGTTGVAVLIEGRHDCMRIRGIKSHGAILSYRLDGVFDTDPVMQQRFFSLVKE